MFNVTLLSSSYCCSDHIESMCYIFNKKKPLLCKYAFLDNIQKLIFLNRHELLNFFIATLSI